MENCGNCYFMRGREIKRPYIDWTMSDPVPPMEEWVNVVLCYCHRESPKIEGRWPKVAENNWCGEWRISLD